MIKYIRLLDEKFYDTIMRLDGPKEQYYWNAPTQEWIKSGLFVRYTMQEDLSDMYDEISFEEAMIIISKQK